MRQIGGHQPLIGIGNQRNTHDSGHVDDEGEDEHDDERHERIGIHQLGQISSVDRLTFHSTGDFFPLSCQVPDATGRNIRWVVGLARPSRVIQNTHAPTRGSE